MATVECTHTGKAAPMRYKVTVWHGEHMSVARVVDMIDADADALGLFTSEDGPRWIDEARALAARLNAKS